MSRSIIAAEVNRKLSELTRLDHDGERSIRTKHGCLFVGMEHGDADFLRCETGEQE